MGTINLYVGNSSSGERVYEELPVVPIGCDAYRLLASPGLVLGVARDDEIKVNVDNGEFEVLKRGKNLCLQIYTTPEMSTQVDQLSNEITGQLGGTLDGRTEKQVVFSVPVSAGFQEVEDILNSFVKRNDGAEWYYGNVYDNEDGVTPLNWWLD